LHGDAIESESKERARPWLIERNLPNTQAADILKLQLGAVRRKQLPLSLGVTANLLLMDERRDVIPPIDRHFVSRNGRSALTG